MGLTYGLIALAAVFGVFAFALFTRVRTLSTSNAGLRKDYDEAREQIGRAAGERRDPSVRVDVDTERVAVPAAARIRGATRQGAEGTANDVEAVDLAVPAVVEAWNQVAFGHEHDDRAVPADSGAR